MRYNLVPGKTDISFKVKNFWFTITGSFNLKRGFFDINEKATDLEKARIILDAGSIDTDDTERDKSLKSKKFFDVQNHPEIKFRTSELKAETGKAAILTGFLTIKETTHPFELHLPDFKGLSPDKISLPRIITGKAHGTLNRLDYDIGGGISDFTLGRDVRIIVRYYAVKSEVPKPHRKPNPGTVPDTKQ